MSKRIISALLVMLTVIGIALGAPSQVLAADNPTVTISSVDDWMSMMSGKSVTNKDVVVTAEELDFKGLCVKPVKDFCGTFDGNGVVIKNLNILSDSSTYGEAGLFGCLGGASTFKNFVITDSNFEADQWVGAVCCCGGGNVTAENIYISETVTITAGQKNSNSYAGGLFGGFAGSVTECKISNCVFAGTISARGRYNGGLVGALHKCPKLTVENSMVLGNVVNNKNYSCGFVGSVQNATIIMSNCIYAGDSDGYYDCPFFANSPRSSTVINCYAISIACDGFLYGSTTCGGRSGVEEIGSIDELFGLDAPLTVEGFTKRDGDIMFPTGLLDILSRTLTQKLYDGASVRMSDPTGLRFIATLNDDFLQRIKKKEQGKEVSFGIMIAPTDYVEEAYGEFTVEALNELGHESNYTLIPAEKLMEGGESEGYYTFSGVLSNVKKENYRRSFSARAYVMADGGDGDVKYYYSSYDPAKNSRSIATVSRRAHNDVSSVCDENYKYETGEGSKVYSPYPSRLRNVLTEFYKNDVYGAEATPESLGLSSADITRVLEGLEDAGLSMHSMLVMKDGYIVAEGYSDYFDENSLHRMYSVSKSFVAMAVGLLAEEGKISLDDTIDKYFPEYVTGNTDPRITKAKIVDLLMMASPFDKVASCGDGEEDWIYEFFDGLEGDDAKYMKYPGTTFCYDTGATHILSTIVERETGMPFLEYLKQKALLEVGFSENSWCVKAPDPAGYSWGGSGVMCTTRDLAVFANLVMNKGEYNGKQLLPREYVEAATSYQISTREAEGNNEYYGSGYGYQIWMNPYGFAFMGMGGQVAYCVPDKGLVIVFTADNQGNGDAVEIVYDLVVEHIIKKTSADSMPENQAAYARMLEALDGMEIPYQSGSSTSSRLSSINGKTYVANGDGAKISSFRLDFDGDEGTLTYVTPRGEKVLYFGIGKNVECLLDEPQYYGDTIGQPNGVGYRCLCSGAWTSSTTFVLRVQVIDDYFGNMTITFDLDSSPTLKSKKTAEWFLAEYEMNSAVSYTKS